MRQIIDKHHLVSTDEPKDQAASSNDLPSEIAHAIAGAKAAAIRRRRRVRRPVRNPKPWNDTEKENDL